MGFLQAGIPAHRAAQPVFLPQARVRDHTNPAPAPASSWARGPVSTPRPPLKGAFHVSPRGLFGPTGSCPWPSVPLFLPIPAQLSSAPGQAHTALLLTSPARLVPVPQTPSPVRYMRQRKLFYPTGAPRAPFPTRSLVGILHFSTAPPPTSSERTGASYAGFGAKALWAPTMCRAPPQVSSCPVFPAAWGVVPRLRSRGTAGSVRGGSYS